MPVRGMVAVFLVAASALPLASARSAAAAADPRYSVAPAAAWVDILPVPDGAAGEAPGAVDFLLLDRQIRLDDAIHEHRRVVLRPTNAGGVESEGRQSIDFDPSKEQLTVHHLTVTREGRTIDQLKLGGASVLQRETGLESNLIDGRLTLNLLVTDLRVGDVLDLGYTIRRRTPEWGDRYWAAETTQYGAALQYSRLRFTHPESRPVRVQDGSGVTPQRTVADGRVTLEWRFGHQPALLYEDGAPAWYRAFPAIEFSEFSGWDEIVTRARPLYAVPAGRSPEFTALVAQFAAQPTPQARALAVLRFVQDEVRYTGVFIGEGAYRPTPPDDVLRRRFGDCKEKTLLAAALLGALGIDAVPALVSARWREHVVDRLPSPGAFDHAILKLVLEGRHYWFDLTTTGQGGALDTMVQADFGRALPIAAGTTELVPMPRVVPGEPEVIALNRFDLRAGIDAPGTLEVTTRYRGAEADAWRRLRMESTLQEIGAQYLKYYRTRYPAIESLALPVVTDDRDSNLVVVAESYRVPNAFAAVASGGREFVVLPDVVEELVDDTTSPVRRTPLALAFPKHVRQTIEIELPEAWSIRPTDVAIEAPGFAYASKVTTEPRRVTLDYSYRADRDHVTPDELAKFVAERSRALDDVGYSLTYGAPVAPLSLATLNGWLLLALAVGALAGAALWQALARRDLTGWRQPGTADGPVGLGGWMILPTLHVVLLPLILLVSLYPWREFLHTSTWDGIATSTTPSFARWGAPLVLLVLGGTALLVVWGGQVIRALLTRSVSFPMLYIAYSWVVVGWGIVATVLDYVVSPPAFDAADATSTLLRDLLGAGIWTLYMLRSTRVRATFTRTREPPPAPKPAPGPAATVPG